MLLKGVKFSLHNTLITGPAPLGVQLLTIIERGTIEIGLFGVVSCSLNVGPLQICRKLEFYVNNNRNLRFGWGRRRGSLAV